MPIRRLLCAAALLASILAAQSEDHPIERSAKTCLERAATPAAMADCTRSAAAEWEAEAARLVDELSALLPPGDRPAIKTAHAEWLRYKAAETRSIAAIYANLKGGAATVMAAEDIMELVRNRALELKKYIGLTKEFKQ